MGKIIKNGRVYAGGLIVDAELDTTSENPIQNKVVAGAINQINSDLSGKIIVLDYTLPASGGIVLDNLLPRGVTVTNCIPLETYVWWSGDENWEPGWLYGVHARFRPQLSVGQQLQTWKNSNSPLAGSEQPAKTVIALCDNSHTQTS